MSLHEPQASAPGEVVRVLEVRNLRVRYGAIEAVHGVDLHVNQGEIVSIIGANGAGKTSILMRISGVIPPAGGTVSFCGQEIQSWPAHRIVAAGLTHVPEGRRLFARMTVWENLAMGTYAHGVVPSSEDVDRVFELFPVLKERRNQLAGTLSGGEQQMLAIGRGLVSRPRLLLLDEPSMGLAPKLVALIFHLLQEINKSGVTMLLVEQNARTALKISSRAYVLETGLITVEDNALALMHNEAVRKAYLGG